MPTLGDFIGALLSDAANARVRADIEAIKLASSYSGHELLRHLPVPRFRLPDITVEFPVLVSEMRVAENQRILSEPTQAEVRSAVDRAIESSGVPLPPGIMEQVRADVQTSIAQSFAEAAGSPTPNRVWTAVQGVIKKHVGSVFEGRPDGPEMFAKFEAASRSSFQALLAKKIAPSPHLEVRVASGDLKAHGDHETLVRVRLTMSEDAYEVVGKDGSASEFTLVPE